MARLAPLAPLSLGLQTAATRPRLLAAAWMLHACFAVAATLPAVTVFTRSLAHRPLASGALLEGFSVETFIDWRAAYGSPLIAYYSAALALAAIYGIASVILEALVLPAYLRPFEGFHRGGLQRAAWDAVPGLLWVAAGSLGVWMFLWGAFGQARVAMNRLTAASESERLPTLLFLAIVAALAAIAALMRVLLNLWKCACVTGGGMGEALAAARRRPGSTVWLALTTIVVVAIYGATAGAVALFALNTRHVVVAVALEQLTILAAVALRLWLLAAATILWRSFDPVVQSP